MLAACVLAASGGVQRADATPASYGAPTGAPMLDVSIDPTDPSVMAVTVRGGSMFHVSVWITWDGGVRWKRVSDGSQVAFDPTVRGLAYVGDAASLAVSTDAGRTRASWLLALGNKTHPNPLPYVTGTGLVYAVNETGEIKQSADHGKTWTNDPSLPATFRVNEVTAFAVSSSSNLAYAALGEGAVYRFVGGAWQAVASPAGSGCAPTALAVSPADEQVVLESTSCGVFRTSDGGDTWAAVGMTDPGSGGGAVTFDPSNPNRAYMAGRDGIEISTDGGATFGAPIDVFQGQTTRQIAVDPTNSSRLFAVTVAGLFGSADGGQTWTPRNTGFKTRSFVLSTASDPSAPRIVYAGTRGGIWRSTDAGATWSYSESGLLPNTIQIRSLTVDRENPATVYLQGSTGYYVSRDQGASWSPLLSGPGLLNTGVSPVAIDPDDDSHVALAYGGGVDVSDDGGATFAYHEFETDPALGPQSVSQVAFDPANGAVIYAGAVNGLWRSTDDGDTWSELPGSPTGSAVALAIDPHRPSLIYYQSAYGGLEVSRDGGVTWQARPLVARTLTLDPAASPSAVYATVHMQGASMAASFDGGKTWIPGNVGTATGDEPDTASLAGRVRVRGVSGRERELYTGDETVSRGIFIANAPPQTFPSRNPHVVYPVVRGVVRVSVLCQDNWHAPCVGELRLETRGVLDGTAFYTIPPNTRRRVPVRLNQSALLRLHTHVRIGAYASLFAFNQAGKHWVDERWLAMGR